MERKGKAISLIVGVYALAGLARDGWAVERASNVAIERIIRLKTPQNTVQEAQTTLGQWGLGRLDTDENTALEVINQEEGLVKVSLTDEQVARLEADDQAESIIESISENRAIYKPLVHYSMTEIEPTSAFTETPMLAGLPDVLMPPVARPGADPQSLQDWSLKKIAMPQLGRTLVHPSIVTAVIDTGVDYNHEDLIGAMWRKTGRPTEVGYDFAQNSDKPWDLVNFDLQGCLNDKMCSNGFNQSKFLSNPGHGTHCAGHIAAVAGNSMGIQGAGAGTPLIGVKIFFDKGHRFAGSASDAAAIKGIDYAIKNGAKIISASWGGPSSRVDAERSELRAAIIRAQKAGVLVVVAAGNNAIDQDAVSAPVYPAAFNLDNMIVVAATDQTDKLGDFSNYGAKSVHIAAPGVKILSTTVGSQYSDEVARAKSKSGRDIVIHWDGTSMATPIVAGAAAAVWSKYPNMDYRQVKARILASARRVPGLTGKVLTGGVLNVAAALR